MDEVLVGFGLGLAAGAGFGPVNIAYTRVGFGGRRRDVLAFGFSALLVDTLLLVAGAVGVRGVGGVSNPIELLFCLISAGVVLGVGAKGLVRQRQALGTVTNFPTTARPWLEAAILGLTNPLGIALWLSIGAASASSGFIIERSIGAFVGDLTWFSAWGAMSLALRHRLGDRLTTRISLVSSAVLVLSGLTLIAVCVFHP